MKVRATLAVVAVLAATTLSGATLTAATPAAAEPITAQDCGRTPGATQPATNWAIQRLDIGRLASISEGRSVSTGQPIRVAVIDSGLDRRHPQLQGVDAERLQDAIPNDPAFKFDDCVQHGTWVTALIAAQHSASVPSFFGIAPQVRIIPIRVTNNVQEVSAANVARAIDLAIASHAQIANLSLSIGDNPAVKAAVGRARAAGMLIVAAAGNDGDKLNPAAQYPAKYSTTYDNVVAVAATTANDTVPDYSDSGSYVDVGAPGDNVQTVGVNGGYLVEKGTSFATPLVTGTAALVLATHPDLAPKEIRDRLESTADSPPETVPSPHFGYGIVNPYLALTTVQTDPAGRTASSSPATLHLGVAPPEPDRTLQHVALGAGFGLLGLTALVLAGAAVLRGNGRRVRRSGT